ncbi:hypothetical protein EZS27_014895 [termite gut metagenome]|uniref:HNH domain-containing protein n=1 Tax=termite gut metagenome TaxID=433724 RepID=A0A5J4RSK9_9ZZZZ
MKSTKEVFKMPNAVTIKGRLSSITNSFVNGIIPVVKPNKEELDTAIKILEENSEDMRCIYCGDPMTEWDHLFPLVEGTRPTGYISEIRNLVPTCGKCNQSKRNINWKEWMTSGVPQSPQTRKIADLDHRIELIEKYIGWGNPKRKHYIFSEIIDNDLWEKYWGNHENIIAAMEESEVTMKKIKKILEEKNVDKDE